MEPSFSFHFLSLFLGLYCSLFPPPSFSLFVLEAGPKVIALHWQRGLSSYFSQRVPCALAGIAFLVVTCSSGRATWEPPPLMHCCTAGLNVCVRVCDQVVGDTWSLLLFIWPASQEAWGSGWSTQIPCTGASCVRETKGRQGERKNWIDKFI